jgi:2-hydroxy-3-oxopropionate reductase
MDTIGCIGLGIMGKPMALNLLKAGFRVAVLESSVAAPILVEAGATAYPSVAALTTHVDVVITMLPDSPEVDAVVLGDEGVLHAMSAGKLFIDMSTIAPGVSKVIYEKMQAIGVEALDAPVSGGQVGAENASLSIMVGGNKDAFTRALPIFEALGKNIVLIGPAGAGQTTKACNQMIVGITIQAVAEAFSLASHAGIDVEKMREVLLGGFAQSKILDLHGRRMIDGNFKPGFKMKLHKKDLEIALATSDDLGLTLLGTTLVADLMAQAVTNGNGELDHSALYLFQS